MVRGLGENFLNIGSHTGISKNVVTLVNNKEFAVLEVDKLSMSEIAESAWSSDDDVGGSVLVSQFLFVVFNRNSSEIAPQSNFWLFEVFACISCGVPSLLKSLKIW